MRKYTELGELKTGCGDWCNNATFSYFYRRTKSDRNGNSRYIITVILFSSVLEFTAQCYQHQIKELAERFVKEYLETEDKTK